MRGCWARCERRGEHAAPSWPASGRPSRACWRGCLQSGIAMAMIGSSRPASGCEHHASHFWDLLAGARASAPLPARAPGRLRDPVRDPPAALRLRRRGARALSPPRAYEPLDRAAREWLGEPSPALVDAVEEKRGFLEAGASSAGPRRERWEERARGARPGAGGHLVAVEAALEVAAHPGRARASSASTRRRCGRAFATPNRLRAPLHDGRLPRGPGGARGGRSTRRSAPYQRAWTCGRMRRS